MDSGCLHHLFCSKYTLSGASALCWQSSGQNGGYDQWDPRGFQHRHQNESGARVQLSEAYWRLITEGALNTHGSKNTLEVEWYDWLVLLLLYTLLHQNLCKTCCRFWRFDILMNMDGIHRFLHDEKRWVLSQGAIHKSSLFWFHLTITGFATSEFQSSRRYNGMRICPCIRTPRKQATVMLVALDCWWLTLLDSVGSCFFFAARSWNRLLFKAILTSIKNVEGDLDTAERLINEKIAGRQSKLCAAHLQCIDQKASSLQIWCWICVQACGYVYIVQVTFHTIGAPSEVLLTRNKEDKVVEVVVGAVGKPSASAVDEDCLASLVSLPGMAQSLPTPAGSETRVRRVLAEFKSLQSGWRGWR